MSTVEARGRRARLRWMRAARKVCGATAATVVTATYKVSELDQRRWDSSIIIMCGSSGPSSEVARAKVRVVTF